MAQLTVSTNTATTTRSLTTDGPLDWEHWQATTTTTRMTSSPNTISDWSAVGTFVVAGYNNDNRTLTASNPSVNDQDGIYSGGVAVTGNGFQITCPATDTQIRTLTLYFGQFSSDAVLTVSMTGGGVTTPQTFSFSDPGSNTAGDMNATITFQSASAGQTLTITWLIGPTFSQSYGNVTISGAALSQVAAPATSMARPSAPAFLVIGPGRLRSPMGVGRVPGATGTTTLVTLALSGSSITMSAGTPLANISYSATGSAITSSAGTTVSNISYSATGSAATASRGTPVSNVSYAASGSGLTASAGTTTANLAALPAGSAATFAAGTLTSALSYALTGSQGTTAAGTVVAAISRALSGTSATTATGTVLSNISAALTGSGATSSAGTPVANISLSASGSGLTVTPGTVTIGSNVTIALAGQSMTVSAGTAGVVVTVPLAGLGLTVSAGTVTQSGGSTVTFARNAILFSGEKSVLPAAREWKRTHDN